MKIFFFFGKLSAASIILRICAGPFNFLIFEREDGSNVLFPANKKEKKSKMSIGLLIADAGLGSFSL